MANFLTEGVTHSNYNAHTFKLQPENLDHAVGLHSFPNDPDQP
jgi:hypothetical protein